MMLLVIALSSLTIPAQAQSSRTLVVSCEDRFPPPPIKVERKVGDTDIFTFTITATSGTLSNIRWDYPKDHTAEEWGTWSGETTSTLTWNPPQQDGLKAAGVFNIGVSGNISCGSGGDGDGPPLTFATSVNGEVYAKHWKPEPDITGGVIIAPQNQSATPTPAHVMTKVRDELNSSPVLCEVTEATDLDTWEVLDETDTEEDDVIYTWSASGGQFKDPAHPETLKDTVEARVAQWYAPENIVGHFTLTCTIDDKPKEVEKPDTGRRDDPKIVRTVEVMVVSIHIDPQSLVLENGEINKQTYNVSVYPPEAAQYINFGQVSGSGNVTVEFDKANLTLTITGQDAGNFTLNATSTETGQLLGAFSGKVLGENDPPPGPDDFWPDLNLPPAPPPGDPPAPPPVVWTPSTPISGGDILLPQDGKKTVKPGESVSLQVATATDEDSKYLGHTLSEMVPEAVSYEWKDQDDKTAEESESLSVDPNDHTKATWTAPTKEGTYTVICTLVDANTPVPQGEYGSRNDDDVERHFTITVQEEKPDVDTGGDIRAAAGHINDDVHKATITLTATDKDTDAPTAATLYLSFEGNTGSEDAKRAKFYLGPNPEDQVEEMTVTTDPVTGKASVTVISSDVISQDIKVKVEWKDSEDDYKDVGSVNCDFGAVESKRRFGIILTPDLREGYDKDQGWDFKRNASDSIFLRNEGSFGTATIYLKFRKDLSLPIDEVYFDGQGNKRTTLSDATNWLAVNGHKLRISIDKIRGNTQNYNPDKRYVYFSDSTGQKLATLSEDGQSIVFIDKTVVNWVNYQLPPYLPVTTAGNGTATVYLRAGEEINKVTTVELKAVELTQKAQ